MSVDLPAPKGYRKAWRNPASLTAEEASALPAHKRVSLEYGVVLRHLAEMLMADQTGALALDLFSTLETALEQRVATLVAVAYQEGRHDGEKRVGELYDENDRLRFQLALVTRDRHDRR